MMMMIMLLFERSKYDEDDVADRKDQSAQDDVVDRKVKVLKMLLLIERSKMLLIEALKVLMLLKIEDYLMLKSFQ